MKKVCLIGCGQIGRTHARNLRGKVELSFCSRSQESAGRFSAEFGGGRVFERFEEVLEDASIDALVVSSPPQFHCQQVTAGLEAGKSVLVEKPMCVHPEEIEQIEQAASAHPDCFVMVAENYYYKPSTQLLGWLLRRGFAGEVQKVEVKKLFSQEASGWKEGYGALLEGGIHFVALVSALLDAAPERVEAKFPGQRAGKPERRSHLRMQYPGGIEVELRYAWNARSLLKGTFQHSRITGAEGRIVFESNGLYVRLKSRKRRGLYFPGLRDLMGYQAMTRDFLRCLEEEEHQPLSDLEKAKRDLGIVFAAYRYLAA